MDIFAGRAPKSFYCYFFMEVFILGVSNENVDMVNNFPVVKSNTSDNAVGNMAYLNGKLYSFNGFWASPDFIDKWLHDEPATDKAHPES